jgi:hypothetical protein
MEDEERLQGYAARDVLNESLRDKVQEEIPDKISDSSWKYCLLGLISGKGTRLADFIA